MRHVKPILATLVLAGFLGIPLMYAGPQLIRDASNASGWKPADELRVVSARCTRWQVVVSTCNIGYRNVNRLNRITSDLHYFFYGRWDNEPTSLLQAADDADHVITTQGLRDLTAREITSAAWLVASLALVGFLLYASIRYPARTPPPDPLQDRITPETRGRVDPTF